MVDVLYKVYVLTLRFKYYFDDAKLCKNAKTKRISFKTKPNGLTNMFKTGETYTKHTSYEIICSF